MEPEFKTQFNLDILGSAFYWGGFGYFSYYPRGKDYKIFDLIKKHRQGFIDTAEWEQWQNGYVTNTAIYIPHIKNTMRRAYTNVDSVIPYCNARGAEFNDDSLVFQDEWLAMDQFTMRSWDISNIAGMDSIISPVQSYQDYVLWYFKKMLDSRAMDGIYFDCTYPIAVYDRISGSAYTDDDGILRPGTDIFAMRDLLKRTAVLAWQNRGYNMNVSHMTHTQLVPVNTWAGVNLTWEDKYGLSDFQERFSREYLLVESIGLQTGSIPASLGRVGIRGTEPARTEKLPWIVRTMTGVSVTHEIKDWGVIHDVYKDTWKRLYDFGYGSAECGVYNYWDGGYPVKITGIESSSLLLVKSGSALVIVTDYGNGGNCKLRLDLQALRLPAGKKFYDLETGQSIEIKGTDSCAFTIQKHDFKLITYK